MKTQAIVCCALCLALAVSCGPSHRRTYQSDNAFERCFDRDYNPAASIPEKQSCWTTWLNEYVYNQPKDKIDYAALRLSELKEKISIPGPPGPAGALNERPKPTAAQRAEQPAKQRAEQRAKPAAQDKSGTDECEQGCKSSRSACEQSCNFDAGVSDQCSEACIAGYRACMSRCFSN